MAISKRQTGGSMILPYYIHVVVGDERALPTRKQSIQNLVSVAAIPTAFLVTVLATALSAGVLTGPSAALAPLVSGCVINGVVVDTAAIAAGTVVASRAAALSEMLLKKHPTHFMNKTGRLRPGKRFVVVTGGVSEPLDINCNVKESAFHKLGIDTFKSPTDTIKDKIQYYLVGKSEDSVSNDVVVRTTEEGQDAKMKA